MNWPAPERWDRLWRTIGGHGDASAWYDTLTSAYAERHRHYHNQQHIAECLEEFDRVRHLADNPEAVELALWFHDAVYDPRAGDNEEQSATLAMRCLEGVARADLSQAVAALVIATKAHNTEASCDAALVVDIDLSILGREEARFAEYEAGIRAEYAWVPQEAYNSKRAEILQVFLNRRRIYSTQQFFERYESRARSNLAHSIGLLTRNERG